LLLNLGTVLERHVLHDVRLCSRHNRLGLRVLPHDLHDLGVFSRRDMNPQMRRMVLVHEGFNRLTVHNRHVLRHRINRFHVIFSGTIFSKFFIPKTSNHLAVQIGRS
jgi:hypothetical protein